MADKQNLPQDDKPLSVAEGAPETIEVAGAKCRIPGNMDIRIANLCDDKCQIDEEDYPVIVLYCCLHTTKKDILKLWQQARKSPEKLWESIIYWQAKVPVAKMTQGLQEITDHLNELHEEQELDADEDSGDASKKKTGSQ